MKGFLWMTAGISAAVLGLIVWDARRPRPVQVLANRLERAWSDHHTIV
jgi:hypothetical protein